MKHLCVIFCSAFVLNAVWENLHARLYATYQGAAITEFILLRASVADALIITGIALLFLFFSKLRNHAWGIILVGIVVAVPLEWWGLLTHRWTYNALMPVVPFVGVGLTPTLQLGLLGYASFVLSGRFSGCGGSIAK